jgi:hypothetical protein
MRNTGLVLLGVMASALAGCGQNTTTADAGPTGSDAPAVCAPIDGTYLIAFSGCAVGLYENPVTVTLDAACDATFESTAGKTIPPITGVVSLEADGSFAATDLMIGSETLSCTGEPGTSNYVVTCGACVITLSPPV